MSQISAGMLGLSLGGDAAELLSPAAQAVTQDRFKTEVIRQSQSLSDTYHAAIQYDRMRQLNAINVQRLMQMNPHLYNEVLAGERLATGTAVFGGQPRTDLLDILASRMSQGQIGKPDSAVEALGQRLL